MGKVIVGGCFGTLLFFIPGCVLRQNCQWAHSPHVNGVSRQAFSEYLTQLERGSEIRENDSPQSLCLLQNICRSFKFFLERSGFFAAPSWHPAIIQKSWPHSELCKCSHTCLLPQSCSWISLGPEAFSTTTESLFFKFIFMVKRDFAINCNSSDHSS